MLPEAKKRSQILGFFLSRAHCESGWNWRRVEVREGGGPSGCPLTPTPCQGGTRLGFVPQRWGVLGKLRVPGEMQPGWVVYGGTGDHRRRWAERWGRPHTHLRSIYCAPLGPGPSDTMENKAYPMMLPGHEGWNICAGHVFVLPGPSNDVLTGLCK